jgi:hypothetical protein
MTSDEKVRALIAKAISAAETSPEEARTCAFLAVKLIHEGRVLITDKRMVNEHTDRFERARVSVNELERHIGVLGRENAELRKERDAFRSLLLRHKLDRQREHLRSKSKRRVAIYWAFNILLSIAFLASIMCAR